MENTVTIDLEDVKKLFATQQDAVDKAISGGVAKLEDWAKGFKTAYSVDGGQVKAAVVEEKATEETAELAESATSQISKTVNKVTDFQVMGIPLGTALVGGFVAIFATELVDGYFKNQSVMIRGVIKLGGAFVVVKFLPKYLGKDLCNAVALLMAFDGLKNDLIPGLFGYATTWANKLTGTTTTAGLGWTGGPAKTASKLPPANTTKDYYAAAGLTQ
jgi:hypothetical protein